MVNDVFCVCVCVCVAWQAEKKEKKKKTKQKKTKKRPIMEDAPPPSVGLPWQTARRHNGRNAV